MKVTAAVKRQIDNAGIIDASRNESCDAAKVQRLNKMLQGGELKLTPILGWGMMTHHIRVGMTDYHVRIEE